MPQITTGDAAQRLIDQVTAMDLDDLRDAHNELFPATPIPPIPSGTHGKGVRQKVLDYLRHGVAVEEILDLWGVVFPDAWNAYYDDETGMIHYLNEPETVTYSD